MAPLTTVLLKPRYSKNIGSSEAITEPQPIKKVCIAKPEVCCAGSSLSPTKARNGSIDTLIDASMIHSANTAIQMLVELGMANMARVARMAPIKKNGRRRPHL